MHNALTNSAQSTDSNIARNEILILKPVNTELFKYPWMPNALNCSEFLQDSLAMLVLILKLKFLN